MATVLNPPNGPMWTSPGAAPSVVSAAPTRRSRARSQWLILGAALTVLAGVLVAWGLGRAADRVDVVSLARPVPAGAVITADDLTVTPIAFDAPVTGLVPAGSLAELVGRTTTIDLAPGTLLTVGMWADGTGLAAGETLVGALLPAGRFPARLVQGTTALAASLDASGAPIAVRVIESEITEQGALSVTVAAPQAVAVDVARLAATDQLVLLGLPTETSAG